MTTQQRATPPNWPGTVAEWIVYGTLLGLGKRPDRDFIYGGRQSENAITFSFTSPPDLGINVVCMMQTYSTGVDRSSVDQLTRQQALGTGVRLIFIDDVDLEQDPSYYVEEALKYRDHSQMGG